MRDSKLVKTFGLLEPNERLRFGEYVRSPYFNKHERLIQLADILVAAAPDFEGEQLSRLNLSKQIFGTDQLEYQKLSDLFTYLYRLLEKFIAQQAYDNDSAIKQNLLLASFRKKGMDRQFEQLTEKRTVPVSFIAEERMMEDYKLHKERDLYFTAKDSRTKDKSIEQKALALDRFYLVAKLKSCCEMLNRQNIVREQYRIDFLDEILQLAQLHAAQEKPMPEILVYHCIALTIIDNSKEAHYHRLTQLLDSNASVMEADEVRSMYDFAQNYCIKKINTGRSDYLREIFELYKSLLANGLILADGQLSQWDYKNIVTVACRLQEFGWSEQFLNQYKDKLPEQDRENAYAYNLASMYYSGKEFGKAMKLLQEVTFTDVYYGLGARSLLLKIYYEAWEMDPLYSLFESFRTYLRRNDMVSEYQFKAHMNLVKLTHKLADLKVSMISSRKETVAKDLDKLRQRMASAGDITNASWLQEKMNELAPATVVAEMEVQ